MNINFHYFAVRYLTNVAGFEDSEGQFIAEMCQFINDNNQEIKQYIKKSDIPREILDRGLYKKTDNGYEVSLLLTSLKDWNDKKEFEDKDKQQNMLVPFYYFPQERLNMDKNPIDYEVVTIHKLGENNLFDQFFYEAKRKYKDKNKNKNRIESLMMLGVLIHILSNTYVNNLFNGFESDKNNWTIEEAKDVITYEDIKDRYKIVDANVGHAKVGNLVNDWNVQFLVSRPDSVGRKLYHTRINNDYILNAARCVLEFLCLFLDRTLSETEWEDNAKPALEKGFTTDAKTVEELVRHWNSLSRPIYSYDVEQIRKRLCDYKEGTFFIYILLVDDFQTGIYKNNQEKEDVHMSQYSGKVDVKISEPIFNVDTYEIELGIKFDKIYDFIHMSAELVDQDTGEPVDEIDEEYQNRMSINYQIEKEIPDDDKNYKLYITLMWKDSEDNEFQEDYYKEYSIIGNKNVVKKIHFIEPVTKLPNKKTIQVFNYYDSSCADYYYAKNATYTSQEGKRQVDIHLPIKLVIQLNENLLYSNLDSFSAWLIDSHKKELKYCNNQKFISSKDYDKEQNTVTVELLSDEWKNHLLTGQYTGKSADFKIRIDLSINVTEDKREGYRTLNYTLQSNDSSNYSKGLKAVSFFW